MRVAVYEVGCIVDVSTEVNTGSIHSPTRLVPSVQRRKKAVEVLVSNRRVCRY